MTSYGLRVLIARDSADSTWVEVNLAGRGDDRPSARQELVGDVLTSEATPNYRWLRRFPLPSGRRRFVLSCPVPGCASNATLREETRGEGGAPGMVDVLDQLVAVGMTRCPLRLIARRRGSAGVSETTSEPH